MLNILSEIRYKLQFTKYNYCTKLQKPSGIWSLANEGITFVIRLFDQYFKLQAFLIGLAYWLGSRLFPFLNLC